MIPFDTVMQLTKAKKETKLLGCLFFYEDYYGYGYIHIEDGEFEASMYDDPFLYEEITSNNFQHKINQLNAEDLVCEETFDNLNDAIMKIVENYNPIGHTVISFTELSEINKIIQYGKENHINFLIFKEDNVWN